MHNDFSKYANEIAAERLMEIATTLRERGHELREIARFLRMSFEDCKNAVSAKGDLEMVTIKVGGGAVFVFTEFNGPNGTGKVIAPSGPIQYSSDNAAVATVDTQGIVTGVAPGTAVISGSDPASVNKVSASDTLTVEAIVPPPPDVAVSATGVLTAATIVNVPAVGQQHAVIADAIRSLEGGHSAT